MPRPLIYVGLVLVALTLIPLGALILSRTAPQATPRIQVVYDMDQQEKSRTQTANDLFGDGRAMRPHVAGTVARGQSRVSAAWADGREGESWIANIPVAVSATSIANGREKFEIYCAPCHGTAGRGDGLVHRRANALAEGTWTQPTDLTGDAVATQPAGQIYATIKNGIRNMPAYATQLPVQDRWDVVAYVRALQRSVRGTADDLDDDARASLR